MDQKDINVILTKFNAGFYTQQEMTIDELKKTTIPQDAIVIEKNSKAYVFTPKYPTDFDCSYLFMEKQLKELTTIKNIMIASILFSILSALITIIMFSRV